VANCHTGRSPLHVASAKWRVSAIANLFANEEVKVAFTELSEQVDITDKTKNALLLLRAHLGNASRLPAGMKAGEHKHKPTRPGKRAWWWKTRMMQRRAELGFATKHAGALDLQDTNYKLSALYVASANGLRSTVARLLSVGARPELSDKRGMTALALAYVKLGNMETLSGGAEAAADTAGGLHGPPLINRMQGNGGGGRGTIAHYIQLKRQNVDCGSTGEFCELIEAHAAVFNHDVATAFRKLLQSRRDGRAAG